MDYNGTNVSSRSFSREATLFHASRAAYCTELPGHYLPAVSSGLKDAPSQATGFRHVTWTGPDGCLHTPRARALTSSPLRCDALVRTVAENVSRASTGSGRGACSSVEAVAPPLAGPAKACIMHATACHVSTD